MVSSPRPPVSIVGVACLLPGAHGPEALYERLLDRQESFATLPLERWDPDVYGGDLPQSGRAQRFDWGAVIEEVDLDWRALHLPPMQAERMHRVEKLMLATMSEALADAGVRPDGGPFERGGIFIASATLGPDPATDHGRRIRRFELAAPVSEALAERLPAQKADIDVIIEQLFDLAAPPIHPDSMAASASVIAGRLANLYDFRGGHCAFDAGMSSSLAAVDRACTVLGTGACDIALVCGVSPLLTPSSILSFAHRGYLGQGNPRPFDPSSPGTLLGEGCAAVVLMRHGDTRGRRVYACIEGIGSSVAPGGEGGAEGLEESVVRAATAAIKEAGCAPGDVRFVESRAGGLPQSDAAEARGLRSAYGGGGGPLHLTSSVANFGFLQAASGLVALVKAAVCVSRGTWPGQPHAPAAPQALPSSELPGRGDGGRPLTVPGAAIPLPAGTLVGVSDAGMTPVAYHAILSAAPSRAPTLLRHREDGVAIVGCGLLVPQAQSVSEFWYNVLNRVDAIGDLPRSRWDVDKLIGASHELGSLLKTPLAGVVQMPTFNPARYGLPPAAVRSLDPSVFLALLAGEQALRDAKYVPGKWDPARVQVILGQLPIRAAEFDAEKRVLFANHLRLTAEAMREAGVSEAEVHAVTKRARGFFDRDSPPLSPLTLRAFTGLTPVAQLAATFGFRGGALSVDAACGSAFSALDIAVDNLLLGNADAVVCGGVAANLLPEYYLTLGMLGFLSSHVEAPFSLRGDGFVPAEGAGVIVLRRLSDAQAAKEPIYAVIRGVGVASDGKGRAVFSPNPAGQQRAIRRALSAARVEPGDIDLLEAHAAGTRVGDRTEMESYAGVFGGRDPGWPLSVSTLKTQIGHLSSAAGIVGLIKVALALREGFLPAGVSDQPPHPELPFGRLPLELASEARPWIVPPQRRRRAGISAFGLGGANYHVILEETEPGRIGERRGPPALATHPAPPPPRGTRADRFVPEMVPVSLPDAAARPPRYSLAGRHALLLLPPGQACAAAEAIAARLRGRGARVSLLGAVAPEEVPAALHKAQLAEGPLSCVFDLSLFCASPDESLRAAPLRASLQRSSEVSFAVLRASYEGLAAAAPGSHAYVAVTAMGGGLGVIGCEGQNPLGAFLVGMVKGLKQELPQVLAKAVDFDLRAAPDAIAEAVLREVEDGSDRMEVGYAGRRMVVNLRRELFREDAPLVRPLTAGEVVLFSGGGYGVAFECACALARLGVTVVTCGRTRPPAPGEAGYVAAGLDDEAFQAFRKDELARRRAADPGLTPVRFNREFEPVGRQRELHRNLERAARYRLPLHYEVCDITDAAQVRDLVRRVRERHGPVRGVAHGAMVEWSRSFPRKTREMIERTLSTKVHGLLNLLDATEDEPLRLFMSFGSGAGRFGNRGQIDYSATNALMTTLLQERARRRAAPIGHVTIDWPAWQEVGAAVANPDIAALVAATGVTSITPAEGTYWFLSELCLGRASESVIVEERMLHDWPFLGPSADGQGERAIEFDDRGVPLIPGSWPLVDYLVERRDGRVRFERRLEVERDYFLAQHRLYGTPIVPVTFGVEILAEAAVLCCPGWEIDAAEDISISDPVKLHRHAPLLLRASAQVVEEKDGERAVLVETRSDLYLKGQALQRDRLHHRGLFRMRRAGTRPARTVEMPEQSGRTYARSFFHMAKDPVGLGPLFCRAESIQVLERGVTGRVRAPRQRDIIRDTSYPMFQADPLLLDAAFQVAANWDGYRHGHVSIPLALGRMVLGRPRRRSEEARVRAEIAAVRDPDVFYDIFVVSDEGELLVELRGVHLRRIARLPTVD